jgi:ADP-ribosyl-[dinitrogen reductase] hydrolase
MCGGEGLEPGQFTDVTERELRIAAALIERGRTDDETSLSTAAAIFFARSDEARGAYGELIRVALDGGEPTVTTDVGTTLRRALDALGGGRDFAEVMRLVVDGGGETRAAAAVAGGLAGAVFGMAGIPMRWASAVHGRAVGKDWRLGDLQELAATLDGRPQLPYNPGVIPRIGPKEVLPGIWAANLDGARHSPTEFAVVSLCRVGEPFPHEVHRKAYLTDDEYNTELDAVLTDVLDDMQALRDDGRTLLVHCHGGASRTGLVLRAWLRRTEGMTADEATTHIAARWAHLGLWNASFAAALERMG